MPKLLVQIEHYIDSDPTQPQAYARFLKRMQGLSDEYSKWKSCVFDSVTFMNLMARKYHQYHLNKKAGDSRQWFGGATDLLEEMLCITIGSLPMVAGVACHIAQDKDDVHGFMVRTPAAPGRLTDRQELMASFSEIYHTDVARTEDGSLIYQLQTQIDTLWVAQSHIDAPNPCLPHYEALWANWKQTRPNSRFLVYGAPGSGKSTFLSTLPKPLLVMAFDPFGKEVPYLKVGKMIEAIDDLGTPVQQVFSEGK